MMNIVEGDDKRVSTEELVNWAKSCHQNVSVHACDMRYKTILRHTSNCSDKTHVYVVKDNHCFPITNKKLKPIASKSNQGGCKDLLKHMIDLLIY